MALGEDQVNYLVKLFEACEAQHDKITKWETDFVDDQKERWEKYGADIRVSDKQWNVLNKIAKKVGL